LKLEKKLEIKNKNNPCFSCPIEQECCRKLKSLRLTKSEYLKHFAQFQEKITVQDYDETCIVSSREGEPCPNWSGKKCAIYADRPVECRIFPYTIGRINKKYNHVTISYHKRTNCPQKEVLTMPDKELKKIILRFANNAFGDKLTFKVKREGTLTKWLTTLKQFF